MPLHTLDGKAAKLLRVRGRVGHQTDTWQGARPSQEPLALRTTVHTDWVSLGDTHLCVQTHRHRKDQSQQKWSAANRTNYIKFLA